MAGGYRTEPSDMTDAGPFELQVSAPERGQRDAVENGRVTESRD